MALLALFDSSVDVVGGHWLDSFHSLHALRRTLRMVRYHHLSELRKTGAGAFLKARLRHLLRDVRIIFWQVAEKLASSLRTRKSPSLQYLTVAEAATIAIRTYRPALYAGSAILFRTAGSDFENPDRSNGFHRYIRGSLQIEEIGGVHLDMFCEPNIEILADRLEQALDHACSFDCYLE